MSTTSSRYRKPIIEQFEDRRLLAIDIDLDQTTGPTIEQYGWDIKGGANIRDQSRSDWYHSTGANIFRVPFFPTAHNQDGTIDESDYANQLRDINLVRNSNPQIKIFASLKLRGADTFPAWMETGESCRIFSHNVFKPDVESYTDALVDYIEYFHQNGIKIDAFGLNNEVENCLTPSRYTDVVQSLRSKLANSPIPPEYRSFDLVGPDAFRVSTGASYVGDLANPDDVIDIAGIHFYAGSSDASFELNANRVDPDDIGGVAQPTSWQEQKSAITSIAVELTEPAVVVRDDITLTNLGLDGGVNPHVITLEEGQLAVVGKTLTISFPDNDLPEGVYQLELSESIENGNGLGLDGNGDGIAGDPFVIRGSQSNGFYKLLADWNGDFGVSVFDFTTFSYWFGHGTDVAPSYVDLSGDEGVSVFDFTGFANNFGKGVNFPAALAGIPVGVGQSNGLGGHVEPIQRTPLDRSVNHRPVNQHLVNARDVHDLAMLEVLHEWNIADGHLLDREVVAFVERENVLPLTFIPAVDDDAQLFSV
jgi:hypothetical protein